MLDVGCWMLDGGDATDATDANGDGDAANVDVDAQKYLVVLFVVSLDD
jgi:hypothetical protein